MGGQISLPFNDLFLLKGFQMSGVTQLLPGGAAVGTMVLGQQILANTPLAGSPNATLALTGIGLGFYVASAASLMATGYVLRFMARRAASKA